ncbi:MAG: protein kinase [Armatimonadetes bacterium]|nr:protein kinase [Armatimonadota bacterium]
MSYGPNPLPEGAELDQRYCVRSVLGQGGFGITYLAFDNDRQDSVVIKELAPSSTQRAENGWIDWSQVGPSAAERTRHQFLREAKNLRSVRSSGVPSVRGFFQQNHTAYCVTEYLGGAQSLQAILARDGRSTETFVEAIVRDLCGILEPIHQRGILHRDIKPSNILLNEAGEVYLVDFGSSREWHPDVTHHQTVEFTPGYAPIEQMNDAARRGPATDIYGLCATAYTLLTGYAPPPVTERISLDKLQPIEKVRQDIRPAFARTILAGLELRFEDRPQSIDEFLNLLDAADGEDSGYALAELDSRKLLLQRLRPGKNECPSCGGILVDPKPLKVMQCPVCRDGVIRHRDIAPNRCPVCRVGFWRPRSYIKGIPPFCPACRIGTLVPEGGLMGISVKKVHCDQCKAVFHREKQGWSMEDSDQVAPWEEWISASGRSLEGEICDSCHAQFDILEDDRLKRVVPRGKPGEYNLLYREEWAKVAAGLEPGQGNSFCPTCSADYYLDDQHLTLLDARSDPFGFAKAFQGCLVSVEQARWMAVGKSSGHRGLVCSECAMEFDSESGGFSLVHSPDRRLKRQAGKVRPLLDWHRIIRHLPVVGTESELDEQILQAAANAYVQGEIGFDFRNEGTDWSSKAERLVEDGSVQEGTLAISNRQLTFGGIFKRVRFDLSQVDSITASGDTLELLMGNGGETFVLPNVLIPVALASGRIDLLIGAESLAARLNYALDRSAQDSTLTR